MSYFGKRICRGKRGGAGVSDDLYLFALAAFTVDDLSSACCAHSGPEPELAGTFTFRNSTRVMHHSPHSDSIIGVTQSQRDRVLYRLHMSGASEISRNRPDLSQFSPRVTSMAPLGMRIAISR